MFVILVAIGFIMLLTGASVIPALGMLAVGLAVGALMLCPFIVLLKVARSAANQKPLRLPPRFDENGWDRGWNNPLR